MVMILDCISLQNLQMKYLFFFFFFKSFIKYQLPLTIWVFLVQCVIGFKLEEMKNLHITGSSYNRCIFLLVFVIYDLLRWLKRQRGWNVKIRETSSSDNFSNFPSLSSIEHLILFHKIFPIERKNYNIYETIWNLRARRAFFRNWIH